MTFDEKFEKLKKVTEKYEQALQQFEEKKDKPSKIKLMRAIDLVTKMRVEVCR